MQPASSTTASDALADRYGIPVFAPGTQIPRTIYQTFPRKELPPTLRAHVDRLTLANPDWRYHLYDDQDIDAFVSEHYGDDMVRRLHRIRPEYGAARADLFRYLLMYRMGGVYLDIKSGFDRPIDEAISPGEQYLLSQWSGEHQRDAAFGLHREIANVSGGEFQNWQITTVAGHPFLRAVIARVLHNIDRYNPWLHGTGGRGVYRLTGPIVYTQAIAGLIDRFPHRIVQDHMVGLVYNAIDSSHKTLFKGHYLMRTDPIVQPRGLLRLLGWSYSFARQLKRRLYR